MTRQVFKQMAFFFFFLTARSVILGLYLSECCYFAQDHLQLYVLARFNRNYCPLRWGEKGLISCKIQLK